MPGILTHSCLVNFFAELALTAEEPNAPLWWKPSVQSFMKAAPYLTVSFTPLMQQIVIQSPYMPCTEDNLCDTLRVSKGRACLVFISRVCWGGGGSTGYVLVENWIKWEQIFLSGLRWYYQMLASSLLGEGKDKGHPFIHGAYCCTYNSKSSEPSFCFNCSPSGRI